MKDIYQGQLKIEELVDVETKLINDLSSTEKMKKDVESTLLRLRRRQRNNSMHSDKSNKLKPGELSDEDKKILE